MTRINLVEVTQLTNKHLMAEYRELPRIFTAVKKLQYQGKTCKDVDIPNKYVLGTGHVKFFYNKIKWLKDRYSAIYQELINRRFDLNSVLYCKVLSDTKDIDKTWINDYKPSPEDIYLNMIRICKRSNIDEVLKELNA